MIRAALCDGHREDRERIRTLLERYPLSLKVTEYDGVETLAWDMETDGARYDLYLLPAGGEAAQRLWDIDGEGLLILLSKGRFPQGDWPDRRVLGALERPVGEKALAALLDRAAQRLRRDRRRVVVITQCGRTQVLRFEEIEYISSANHILRFYLRDGEERTCYSRLDQIAKQLDPELFVRCHQSHVVNLAWVTGHTPKAFHMSSGAVIPISRSYTASARRALEDHLFHISAPPAWGAEGVK